MFTEKQLSFKFYGAKSGDITASGLRAVVSLQEFQGRLGATAQVKIWGLTMSQMAQYSTKIPTALNGGIEKFNLIIEAGDMGSKLSKVVDGPIWASFIDLSGAPDSCFYVSVSGIRDGANPIAAQSQPGTQKAEDLIAAVCSASDLTLNNPSGATAVLRNQATYGSAIDHIEKIAHAANLHWKIEGKNVWLWPPGGTVDDVTINMGPNTGMIGYPAYWESGIVVTSEFNQQVQVGRLMSVSSIIPSANGPWKIVEVHHDLATQVDKGPWFTTAHLTVPGSLGDI